MVSKHHLMISDKLILPEEIGTKKQKKYVTLTMFIPNYSKMLHVLDAVRGKNSRSLVIRAIMEYTLEFPDSIEGIIQRYKILSQQNDIQQTQEPNKV